MKIGKAISGTDLTKNMMTMFTEIMGLEKGEREIPLTEVTPGGYNGVGEIFHKNCGGCLSSMAPITTGEWVCLHCYGYIQKEDADKLVEEGEKEWEKRFTKFKVTS